MPSKQQIIDRVADIRAELRNPDEEPAERYLDRLIDLCEPELDAGPDGTFTNEQANKALQMTRNFTDDQLGKRRRAHAEMEKYVYG